MKDGRDPHTNLGAYLQKSLGGPTTTNIHDIVKRLKARGGQEQMLMFLTGPAGSGKSSALLVAQQFCFEFCLSVGVMWSDKTFLFTLPTQALQHHCLEVLQSPRLPSSIRTVH